MGSIEKKQRNFDYMKIAEKFLLDEVFDLTLYSEFRRIVSSDNLKGILDELISTERKHVKMWRDFILSVSGELPDKDKEIEDAIQLDIVRRVKLYVLSFIARIFGEKAIYIILESIEIHGIKKYLDLWDSLGGGEINRESGDTGSKIKSLLREILKDELVHEDKIIVGQEKEKITPEFVRNVFLGLSDGLVEVLGAVSGFLASFEKLSGVLLAGSIVAVAGAMSMGAGAFVAVSSEREVEKIKEKKEIFLGRKIEVSPESPFKQAISVGLSYIIGSLIPLLPVAFGVKNILAVFFSSFVALIFISYIISFLSGVRYRTYLARNILVISGITLATFTFSSLARSVFGINL